MRTIHEICTSNSLNQKEMEYVVEQYIKSKKNIDVNIDITPINNIGLMMFRSQFNKLSIAFEVAAKYYLNK